MKKLILTAALAATMVVPAAFAKAEAPAAERAATTVLTALPGSGLSVVLTVKNSAAPKDVIKRLLGKKAKIERSAHNEVVFTVAKAAKNSGEITCKITAGSGCGLTKFPDGYRAMTCYSKLGKGRNN